MTEEAGKDSIAVLSGDKDPSLSEEGSQEGVIGSEDPVAEEDEGTEGSGGGENGDVRVREKEEEAKSLGDEVDTCKLGGKGASLTAVSSAPYDC